MVFEEVAVNVTGGLEEGLAPVIGFIRIVGWFVIAYVVFWIISVILNWKKNRYLKDMLKVLEEMNEKLGKTKTKKVA